METFFLFCILMVMLFVLGIGLMGHRSIKERQATLEPVRRHPEHAAEIHKASVMQQGQWQPPAAAKKGGVVGKLVVVALCAIYILSPLDFIPDVLPVLGWGDDLAAGIIGLRALMK